MNQIVAIVPALCVAISCGGPAAHLRHDHLPELTLIQSGPKSAKPGVTCFRGYFYDGELEERANFIQAAQVVCDIFVDPAFHARVLQRKIWFERSEEERCSPSMKDEPGKVSRLIADMQFQQFHGLIYDASGRTTGSTEPCVGNLSITRKRLAKWMNPSERYQVVDTVAHEFMHLVGSAKSCSIAQTTGPFSSSFVDGKRSAEGVDCFVSYQIGSLAACHYQLGAKASDAEFATCLHRVRLPNHAGLKSSNSPYCDPDGA